MALRCQLDEGFIYRRLNYNPAGLGFRINSGPSFFGHRAYPGIAQPSGCEPGRLLKELRANNSTADRSVQALSVAQRLEPDQCLPDRDKLGQRREVRASSEDQLRLANRRSALFQSIHYALPDAQIGNKHGTPTPSAFREAARQFRRCLEVMTSQFVSLLLRIRRPTISHVLSRAARPRGRRSWYEILKLRQLRRYCDAFSLLSPLCG